MTRLARPRLDALATRLGEQLPRPVLKATLGSLLEGAALALCLHRVSEGPTSSSPLSIPARRLDELIELLLSARAAYPRGWLTVTFDDGYADAARYVAARAPALPEVAFTLFVCPEKVVRRAGFRWDLKESALRAGLGPAEAERLDGLPMALDGENARPELLALGDAPEYQLVTAEALGRLAQQQNVEIGNHTNLHAVATALPLELVREDYRRSTALLRGLLGAPPRQLAFPFGTPGSELDSRHLEAARALGYARLWSTEARAWWADDARPGAVLPRCPLDGRSSVDGLAGWLLAKLLNARLKPGRSFAPRG
jgi:peptidoglycan/xylan/chitin deacetylase (PgdA/CDA1 family)